MSKRGPTITLQEADQFALDFRDYNRHLAALGHAKSKIAFPAIRVPGPRPEVYFEREKATKRGRYARRGVPEHLLPPDGFEVTAHGLRPKSALRNMCVINKRPNSRTMYIPGRPIHPIHFNIKRLRVKTSPSKVIKSHISHTYHTIFLIYTHLH